MELLEWQKKALAVYQKQNLILRVDTGLGKGVLGSYIAKQHLPKTVVILCPPHLFDDWTEKLGDWGVKQKDIIRVVKNLPILANKVNLVSYYKLKTRAIHIPMGTLVIADEAHYIKNPQSGRFKILKATINNIERYLALTATLVTKNSLDLYTNTWMANKELREHYHTWYYFQAQQTHSKIIYMGTKQRVVPTGIRDEAIDKYCKPFIMDVTYEKAGIEPPKFLHKTVKVKADKALKLAMKRTKEKVIDMTPEEIQAMPASEYMEMLASLNNPHSKLFQLSNGFMYVEDEVKYKGNLKKKIAIAKKIAIEHWSEYRQKTIILGFFRAEKILLRNNNVQIYDPKKDTQVQIDTFQRSKDKYMFYASVASLGEGIRFKDPKVAVIIELSTIYDYARIVQGRGRLRYVGRPDVYYIYSIELDVPMVQNIKKNIELKAKVAEGFKDV